MNIAADIATIEDVDRAVYTHLNEQIENIVTVNSCYLSLDGNGFAKGPAAGIFNTNFNVYKMRFKPGFALTDGLTHYLFDTTDGARYSVNKGADSLLYIRAGNSVAFYVLSGNYSGFWNALGWNELIITVDSSGINHSAVLNENPLTLNAVGPFTPAVPAEIFIGARGNNATRWPGLIDYVRIYSGDTESAALSNLTAGYEFSNNYLGTPAETLVEQGTGNQFIPCDPEDREYYQVLGHQPDSKALSQLDDQIPLLWIMRKGPPSPSDEIGSTPQHFFEVKTIDGEDNPATYTEIKGGVKSDLTYEVRYITFHEDDERAMTVQLAERFPRHGINLFGPGGNGPFWFETAIATDVPGTRPNELGGIYRVVAKGVPLGEREVATIPAILDIESIIEAEKTLVP